MKYKLLIFALICIIITPLLAGCDVSTRYLDVEKECHVFVNDPANEEFFSGNVTINGADKNDENYYVLTYYDKLLKMSLTNIKSSYKVFLLEPAYHQTSVNMLCNKILNSINYFDKELDNFVSEKEIFESKIVSFGSTSAAAIADLKEFKLDYGRLVEKANNLQKTYSENFSALYHPNCIDEAKSEFDIHLAVENVFSTLIDDCIRFEILEYSYSHPNNTTNLYSSLLNLDEIISTFGNESSNVLSVQKKEKFNSWVETYKLFQNEQKMYRNALKQINYVQLSNSNNITGINKTNYDKIESYVNTNASSFILKTIELIS